MRSGARPRAAFSGPSVVDSPEAARPRYGAAMVRGTRLSRRSLLAAALTALSVVGCLSPTLPLPPPSRPDVSAPDGDGFVRVQGRVVPFSLAVVQNRRSGEAVGRETGETGRYVLVLPARSGDQLDIWYIEGLDKSPSTRVVVPNGEDAGLGGAGGGTP